MNCAERSWNRKVAVLDRLGRKKHVENEVKTEDVNQHHDLHGMVAQWMNINQDSIFKIN